MDAPHEPQPRQSLADVSVAVGDRRRRAGGARVGGARGEAEVEVAEARSSAIECAASRTISRTSAANAGANSSIAGPPSAGGAGSGRENSP